MMISKHQIAAEISEFRAKAADARQLAAKFIGGPFVADLLEYASALEGEAAQSEKLCDWNAGRGPSKPRSRLSYFAPVMLQPE